MSFYSCWDIKPADPENAIPLAELLAVFATTFPIHEFDADGARQSALRRLAALQAIPGVPENVLASYRDASPVAVILADEPGDDDVLSFTVWPERDGLVTGIQISFGTEDEQRACCVMLSRLADALDWEVEDVTDEVS